MTGTGDARTEAMYALVAHAAVDSNVNEEVARDGISEVLSGGELAVERTLELYRLERGARRATGCPVWCSQGEDTHGRARGRTDVSHVSFGAHFEPTSEHELSIFLEQPATVECAKTYGVEVGRTYVMIDNGSDCVYLEPETAERVGATLRKLGETAAASNLRPFLHQK